MFLPILNKDYYYYYTRDSGTPQISDISGSLRPQIILWTGGPLDKVSYIRVQLFLNCCFGNTQDPWNCHDCNDFWKAWS